MLLLKILLCFLSKQLCWTKEAVRMTHLKVQPAFPGSKCWRVWQQVLPSSGKANRCASRSLQFAPKPKFERNYASLKFMIHVHMILLVHTLSRELLDSSMISTRSATRGANTIWCEDGKADEKISVLPDSQFPCIHINSLVLLWLETSSSIIDDISSPLDSKKAS